MLEQFNDAYATAEAPARGNDLPDGEYIVEVRDAVVTTTKETGKPMLSWAFCVAEGDHAGRFEWKNAVITEASVGFVKADIATCGLELARFSDLESRAGELVGLKLKINIVSGKYRNIYINELVGRVEPVAAGAVVADDDDPLG